MVSELANIGVNVAKGRGGGDDEKRTDVFVKEVSYTFSCLATTDSSFQSGGCWSLCS